MWKLIHTQEVESSSLVSVKRTSGLKTRRRCEIMFSKSLKISREFSFSGVSELGAEELKHQVKLEQWKEQITACRGSGMSARRWCIKNQVNQKSYYRWEKEIVGPCIIMSTEQRLLFLRDQP